MQLVESEMLDEFYFASKDRILPFDVVVFKARSQPSGAVIAAPDLAATFRVYYTLSSLYNNKNPEVNAKSVPELASTTQVSLPQTLGYKFWTLNMLNHKKTNAVNVEVKDVFLSNQKKAADNKRLSIFLKVD